LEKPLRKGAIRSSEGSVIEVEILRSAEYGSAQDDMGRGFEIMAVALYDRRWLNYLNDTSRV